MLDKDSSVVYLEECKAEIFEKIITLDQLYFPTPWTSKSWELSCQSVKRYSLCTITQNNQIIAFSLFLLSVEEGLAHLLKIIVLPEYRGHQIGTLCIKSHIAEIGGEFNRFFLEVEEDNFNARALYKSLGFKDLARLKGFYPNGKDGISMLLCN
jgi:[ribosomal protein S18]-alanine N-acetyltransferase